MTSRAAKKIGRLSEYSQCHDPLSARAHIAGDGGENKHGREGGRDTIAQKNIAHSHSEQKKKGREEGKRGPIAFRFNAAISPRFIRGPLSKKEEEEGLQGGRRAWHYSGNGLSSEADS